MCTLHKRWFIFYFLFSFFTYCHIAISIVLATMSVEIPPSKSIILVDSKKASSRVPMYYEVVETIPVFPIVAPNIQFTSDPVDFEARLNANVSGKSVTYNSLSWSQSIYTHTGASAEFKFSVWDGAAWMGPYVMYHKPYNIFKSFTGLPRTVAPGYQDGIEGSYVADWERGLNTDIRFASANTVSVGPIQVAGLDVLWSVTYEASNGILIRASNTLDAKDGNITWRMEECGSLATAHHVHGFGVLESVATGKYVPVWAAKGIDASTENSGHTHHMSDFPPSLIPIKEIDIYCPQITRDRRLQTFRNAQMQKGLGDEMAHLALWVGDSGMYNTKLATREENVWSLRRGTEPDVLRLTIANSETGDALRSSTCFANMVNSFYPSRNALTAQWFIEANYYRGDTDAMNALLFNIDAPVVGTSVPLTTAYGNPEAEVLLDDLVHVMDVYLSD